MADIPTNLCRIVADPISIGFGLACAAVLLLSWLTRRRGRHSDAVVLSWALIASWTFSKVIAAALGWDFARSLYCFTDCMGGLLTVWLYTDRPARWKVALAYIFLFKGVLDVIYAGTTNSYLYLASLNLLFGAEIICVATPGGIATARAIRNRLSGGARLGDARLSGARRETDPR